jgi:hypothetical protein
VSTEGQTGGQGEGQVSAGTTTKGTMYLIDVLQICGRSKRCGPEQGDYPISQIPRLGTAGSQGGGKWLRDWDRIREARGRLMPRETNFKLSVSGITPPLRGSTRDGETGKKETTT